MQQDKANDSVTQELVSALVDGELSAEELSLALSALEHDVQAQESWVHYHVVGEVVRTQARGAMPTGDLAFARRLRTRLAQETAGAQANLDGALDRAQRQAANDSAWRWKWVAGVCCMALAGMMAWQWSSSSQGPVLAQQEHSVASPTLVAVDQQGTVVLRDPRLDQLIAAHQQQGGASPLVMPAGFLRNATYERAGR